MNEVRRCRSTWMYCDGNCRNCEINATSSATLQPISAVWMWNADIRCSNCGYKLETTGLPTSCPNCGAKMDVADNDVGKMDEVEDEHTD